MPTSVNDVVEKAEMLEIDPASGAALKSAGKDSGNETEAKLVDNEQGKKMEGESKDKSSEKVEEKLKEELTKEDVPVEVEAKTGVSFAVVLGDGKRLNAVGLRKKNMLGLSIKIYGFGIYADNDKLRDLLKRKFVKAPSKATKDMYQMVIDSDVAMMVRLVIVFNGLTMRMVKKNFDEELGAAIKKLTGDKIEELTKMIMGEASDEIKLTPVKDEIVSTVESKLLCRAYTYMYLGEDPFDKEAKEKLGASLLSLI